MVVYSGPSPCEWGGRIRLGDEIFGHPECELSCSLDGPPEHKFVQGPGVDVSRLRHPVQLPPRVLKHCSRVNYDDDDQTRGANSLDDSM